MKVAVCKVDINTVLCICQEPNRLESNGITKLASSPDLQQGVAQDSSVITDTFHNNNTNSNSKNTSNNILTENLEDSPSKADQLKLSSCEADQSINQSEGFDPSIDQSETENVIDSQSDADTTPTRQIMANQVVNIQAPIATVDSDCGTASNTPKHYPLNEMELSDNEEGENDLLIVEEGDEVPSRQVRQVSIYQLPVNITLHSPLT